MNRKYYVIQLIVLCFIFCGGFTAIPKELDNIKFLVPENAYDLHTDVIEPTFVVQLSYKIKLQYPKKAIGNDQLNYLKNTGWIECKEKSVDWNHFLDLSGKRARYVYLSSSIFKKNDRLLLLVMLYAADAKSDKMVPNIPPNTVQNVSIVQYDLASDEVRLQMQEDIQTCDK